MALKKPIATKLGVTAQYWRIKNINIMWQQGMCDVILDLYFDRPGQEEMLPMDSRHYRFSAQHFPFSAAVNNKTVMQVAYDKIKEQDPYFSDAEDC